MNVLLLYATTEGQTRKVAERIAAIICAAGHETLLHDMASGEAMPPIETFDALIAAASVHQGYHQDSAINFLSAAAGALRGMHTAFVSVSLSAAMADGRQEAQQYVDRFLETTGWTPAMTLLLGGAIRLSDYDYFERQVMKYVLAQKGVTDLTTDYECTDWAALERFVQSFLDQAAKADARPAAAR